MESVNGFVVLDNEKVFFDELNQQIIFEKGKILKKDFFYPKGIEKIDEKLYVVDCYHNCIKVFDENFEFIYEFGKDILKEPCTIKKNNDNIYVLNKDYGKISIFDKKGNFIREIGEGLLYPASFDLDNNNIYVANTNKNEIQVYSVSGDLIERISNNYKYPNGIKIYKEYLILADQFNKKILVVDRINRKEAVLASGNYFSSIDILDDTLIGFDEEKSEFVETKLDINKLKFYEFSYTEKSNVNFGKYESKGELKYLRKIKELSSDLIIEKPKAIHIKENSLWIAIHNYRRIVEYDIKENKIKNIFQTDMQIEKILVTETKLILLDYFFRDIIIVDRKNFLKVGEIQRENFKRPTDMFLYDEKIYILDTLINRVFVFNKFGKYQNEYNIMGNDNVSIKVYDEKVYILDKRDAKLRIYDLYFNFEGEISLENGLYPEDFCIVGKNIYMCEDGKNILIQSDMEGKIKQEIKGYYMPNKIISKENTIYVSDFVAGDIVEYIVEV